MTRKFKVGDCVRICEGSGSTHAYGDIGWITSDHGADLIYRYSIRSLTRKLELELWADNEIELVTTK